MGNRVRTPTLLVLGTLLAAVPGFVSAQNCSNDGTLTFPNGNVITLDDASPNNLFDRNNNSNDNDNNSNNGTSDREEELNLNEPLTTGSQGSTLVVEGIDLGDYPALPTNQGFDRDARNVWQVEYDRDIHVFNRRRDLVVEVTITIPGNEARLGSSSVTITAEQDRYTARWYPGTNSLRSLTGSLNFRFEDLQNLGSSGAHRAQMTLCVEVSGQSNN